MRWSRFHDLNGQAQERRVVAEKSGDNDLTNAQMLTGGATNQENDNAEIIIKEGAPQARSPCTDAR